MRMVTLILGILGGLAAGFLGFKWYSDASEAKELLAALKGMGGDTSEIDGLVTASYILMAGLAAGIAGGVLGLKGNKVGGILMILFGALPAVWAPKALVFSGLLILAGIFGLLVKPKTAQA